MIAIPASAGPPSFLSKNATWLAIGWASSIVQATIVPLRGIVSGAFCLPTLTCMPVVSLTTSHGVAGQLGTGPTNPLTPVLPVDVVPEDPVLPLVPLAPVLPVVPVLVVVP